MLVTITLLELKNPLKFFALSYTALGILKQLKTSKAKGYKSTGLWTTHYTMSLWESAEDMHEFARSGAHLEAMKQSASLAKEIKVLTIASPTLLDWPSAKARLKAEGKSVKF